VLLLKGGSSNFGLEGTLGFIVELIDAALPEEYLAFLIRFFYDLSSRLKKGSATLVALLGSICGWNSHCSSWVADFD
jgi:hypothetical protein